MARKARQTPQDPSVPVAPMVVTSVRIPPSMRAELVELAYRDGTTVNQQVLWALEAWLSSEGLRARAADR